MGLQPGWRDPALDAALAVAVAAMALLGTRLAPPGTTDPDALASLLTVIGALALVARRHAPVVVLLVTTACVLGYQLRGYPGVLPGLPVLIAIYTAVRAGHRLIAVVVTGVALFSTLVTDLMLVAEGSPREVIQDRLLLAGWLIASGVIGEVSRQRSAYLGEVEQRAAEAERTHEETAAGPARSGCGSRASCMIRSPTPSR